MDEQHTQHGGRVMGLSTEGILFLAFAWGSIITLAIYCFGKVILSERGKKRENNS